MNQQAHMANMNPTGGPVGGTPLMNSGGQRGNDPQTMLNTYIYDYFLKNHHWALARQIKTELMVNTTNQAKPSPGRRDVNGVDDSMDTDSKDDIDKRPDDLPLAAVPGDMAENSFLFDWWSQFWDIFNAQRQRSKPGPQQLQYLAHTRQQSQLRQESQQRILMTNNAQQYRNMMGAMPPNGMPMNMTDMQRKAMQNQRLNPQQMQQMKNQQQHMMQNQMQREGSQMDMNQRPSSPGSAENAPSPNKRPRLDNQGFNGQPMAPGARTQGMQPQNVGTTAAQAGQMLMANGIDPSNMTAQQFNAFQGQTPNVQTKSIQEMNSAGMQNSPMGQQGTDGFQDFSQGNPQARIQNAPPGQQPGGNHALQDYQMQLMLLEQQNKKRLLMARQEQDNITQHPGSGPVAQPGGFPPAMSPQGSRAGPSPNPNDQMKRGTPKLNQAGLPSSPMPDGPMPQNRSSPLPNGFDPSQMPPGMPPQYYQQMGANGMMRPPSSHPGFQGGMTPQQMEMIRRNGGQIPNGMWPQGAQPPMMPQQPQGAQPMPMGTPQQRNNQMPPPPAPAAGNETGRTQPSSPAQPQNQPPTPSQGNKPNPKKKGKPEEKKNAPKQQPTKKGSTAGVTPASESEPPPTPTQTQPANVPQQPTAPANPPQPVAAAPQIDANPASGPFGDLGSNDNGAFNLDFGSLESGDVLENFDFDTFLHTDDPAGGNFSFDASALNFGENGVEADAGI